MLSTIISSEKHPCHSKHTCISALGSWADRSPLHEAASQGRLLALRTLLAQVTHLWAVHAKQLRSSMIDLFILWVTQVH